MSVDLDVAAEEGLEHLAMHHGRQEKLNATHKAAIEEASGALQVSAQAQKCAPSQKNFCMNLHSQVSGLMTERDICGRQ